MRFNIYYENPRKEKKEIGYYRHVKCAAKIKLHSTRARRRELCQRRGKAFRGGGLKGSKGSSLLAAFSKSEWIIRASFKARSFLKYGEGRAMGIVATAVPAISLSTLFATPESTDG